MRIESSIIELYERTRTPIVKDMLQKATSDLAGYATQIANPHSEYHKIPFIGKTAVSYRDDRDEDIVADELPWAERGMKPLLFKRFHKLHTVDSNFLVNLPNSVSNIINQLRPAVERAKDEVLMGTVLDGKAGSPTEGEYIIRETNTVSIDAVDGSPFKGGATGGLLGECYIGKTGDAKIGLSFQPTLINGETVSDYTEFTDSRALDLATTPVVPVNYTGDGTVADSGWTVDKFIAVFESMQARYATRRGTICHALTHKQMAEILRNEKFQNMLFGNQVLKTGIMDSMFNIKFLVTDVLPLVNIGTTGAPKYVRACPTWLVDDLTYGVWDDVRFHVRQPESKIDTIYAGVTFGMGASRMREESVVTMLCDEGFTPKA